MCVRETENCFFVFRLNSRTFLEFLGLLVCSHSCFHLVWFVRVILRKVYVYETEVMNTFLSLLLIMFHLLEAGQPPMSSSYWSMQFGADSHRCGVILVVLEDLYQGRCWVEQT